MTTFNLTADGSTDAQTWFGRYEKGRIPEIILVVSGTFGSGTITVEYTVDEGSTWIEHDTIGVTANFVGTFKIHPDMQYRATLAGATDPDLDVTFLP